MASSFLGIDFTSITALCNSIVSLFELSWKKNFSDKEYREQKDDLSASTSQGGANSSSEDWSYGSHSPISLDKISCVSKSQRPNFVPLLDLSRITKNTIETLNEKKEDDIYQSSSNSSETSYKTRPRVAYIQPTPASGINLTFQDPPPIPTQQSFGYASSLKDQVKSCFDKKLYLLTPWRKTEELSKMKKEFIGVLKISKPDYNVNLLNGIFGKFAKIAQNHSHSNVKFSYQEIGIVSLFLDYIGEKKWKASEDNQSKNKIVNDSVSLTLNPISMNSLSNLCEKKPLTKCVVLKQDLSKLQQYLTDLVSKGQIISSPLYSGKATKEHFLNLCVDRIISELNKDESENCKVHKVLVSNIPSIKDFSKKYIVEGLRSKIKSSELNQSKTISIRRLIVDSLISSPKLHQNLEEAGVYLLRDKSKANTSSMRGSLNFIRELEILNENEIVSL